MNSRVKFNAYGYGGDYRRAVRPVIGYLNDDCRLPLNRLKGALADALHVLSCAAGYKLRGLLRRIAIFCASVLWLITGILGLPNREIGMRVA
jgi:hypothetical protein